MEISGKSDPQKEWFDFYLLQKYFLKEVPENFLDLNERASFLMNRFSEIEALFSNTHLMETKKILEEIRHID